jgi:hypothetical protein
LNPSSRRPCRLQQRNQQDQADVLDGALPALPPASLWIRCTRRVTAACRYPSNAEIIDSSFALVEIDPWRRRRTEQDAGVPRLRRQRGAAFTAMPRGWIAAVWGDNWPTSQYDAGGPE